MKSILQQILKLPFLGKQTSVRDELTGLIETSISNTDTEFDDQEGLLLKNMLGLRDITAEKVRILQDVDHIYIEGLKSYGLYDEVWQAGAVFLPIQSVGVMGDERTYENVVALRAVGSTDGMTADWSHLPHEFLAKVSNDIINKVRGVNRVVYDISSKPPATIEWE